MALTTADWKNDIPRDIAFLILLNTDPKDLRSLGLTCKKFSTVYFDAYFQKVYAEKWPRPILTTYTTRGGIVLTNVESFYFETERFGKIVPHYMLAGVNGVSGKKKTLLCIKEVALSFGKPKKFGGNPKIESITFPNK